MNRNNEEVKLQKIFGFDKFYDQQWNAVEKILKGERVLLIEKTGFGKSLCYQFPATQFHGLTVVFSPLIALMRDQVKFLENKGIPAGCINSQQTPEENRQLMEQAQNGEIKILYIAPERMENDEWLSSVRKMGISLVVIDEAHCVSVWGHDFRPAFQRIIQLVKILPPNIPVLGTTATATPRVAEDIKDQMGAGVTLIRGNLFRPNLCLCVIRVNNEDEKMAWIGEFLENKVKPGNTGLIYTGTRANTDIYARFLQSVGISAVKYHGGLEPEERNDIETGLMNNRWKCVVSTNALGMGIDKKDIRFIIHTQFPASPIHYYQEIGRAGRDGKTSIIVLLYNPADRDLQDHFINSNRPETVLYEKVINFLKKEPLSTKELVQKLNTIQNKIRIICADLANQEIIKEVKYSKTKKFEYQYNAPPLNTESFMELRQFKMQELEKIIEYAESSSCRMNYLCSYLGDVSGKKCGKCDNDQAERKYLTPSHIWKEKVKAFRNNDFPILSFNLKTINLINGVASSYYGISKVGETINQCKYKTKSDFPDWLIEKCLQAYKSFFKNKTFDMALYIPPTESGDLVKHLAEKICRKLKLPLSHDLKKITHTLPQKGFESVLLKKDNLKDVFSYLHPHQVQNKSILLIDDVYDSGATVKEIARILTKLGAKEIAPLVIAKTVGGDLKE